MFAAKTLASNRAVLFIAIITALITLGGILFAWQCSTHDLLPQVAGDSKAFKMQLKTDPNNPEIHLNLGDVYYRAGLSERALVHYREALQLDKSNVRAIYGIGLVARDNRNYKEAELRLNEVLRREPDNLLAAYALAQVFRETGKTGKAVEHYRMALRISPAEANIRAELGRVLEEQGKKGEAKSEYREALRYVPDLKEAVEGLKRLGN